MGNGVESPAKASPFLGVVGDRGRFLVSTGSDREPVVCCGSTHPTAPGNERNESDDLHRHPGFAAANYRQISGLPAAAVPEHNRNMLRVAIIEAQWKRSTVYGENQRPREQ